MLVHFILFLLKRFTHTFVSIFTALFVKWHLAPVAPIDHLPLFF